MASPMGMHWYARSRELGIILRRLDDAERHMASAAPAEIDAAIRERDRLFEEADAVRAELASRGAAVTVTDALAWGPDVRAHVQALGADGARSLLDVLDWNAGYYAENLRRAGVRIEGFSHPLMHLRVDAAGARALGLELLQSIAELRDPAAIRQLRIAGLWLFLWGSVECTVESGS